ncbi:MAG: S8 family serine peptidase [Pseudomonadota bacterium]
MIDDDETALLKGRALGLLEDVLITFAATERTSYLADTPIRTSVWRAFAEDPGARVQLLIEPNHFIRGGDALRSLTKALQKPQTGEDKLDLAESSQLRDVRDAPRAPKDPFKETKDRHVFAAVGNTIIARLDMDVMIRVVLLRTVWFQRLSDAEVKNFLGAVEQVAKSGEPDALTDTFANTMKPALWRFLTAWVVIRNAAAAAMIAGEDGADPEVARWRYIDETCRMLLRVSSSEYRRAPNSAAKKKLNGRVRAFFRMLLSAFRDELFWLAERASDTRGDDYRRADVWSIDLNRSADLATVRSRQTVKVDAAERVFHVSTRAITWAILDSGIDATHPAFCATPGAGEKVVKKDKVDPKADKEADRAALEKAMVTSRVRVTYDFTRLKKLVSEEYHDMLTGQVERAIARKFDDGKLSAKAIIRYLFAAFKLHHERVDKEDEASKRISDIEDLAGDKKFLDGVNDSFRQIKDNILEGRQLDWPLIEPILHVTHVHEAYPVPKNGHGTHVAGILGAQMPKHALPQLTGPLQGMCPDIKLVDLRVCDEHGQSDEYILMSAMQFVAYLNRTRDIPVIQGANISMQIPHAVRNYGCGQTPICKAANRLVDAGVCVVVAAGNQGFQILQSNRGEVASYATSSIMDPGNAEKVITVGATHRESPHSNGVSYFSSRGPTADGRAKPDIIAPGERIVGPAPRRELRTDSGTSMACPHVSAAAAMIMARHAEFIGRPQEIKSILMANATDLGRRREFQGAGLLDVLRALESI